jgi:GntR family transcriptional regulator
MTARQPKPEPFRIALDSHSGVPVYRQIMDRITGAIATGSLRAGDQLPTVRQLAVDLSINPNTVIRAYRELEIRGVIDTQQGTGTFIGEGKIDRNGSERQRGLAQLASECAARAGTAGFTVAELIAHLQGFQEKHAQEKTEKRKS